MLQIAWYYYKAGWTQNEIAEKLGPNRARVISVLKTRASGRVTIHVQCRCSLSDLEHQLCEKWHLKEALLVPKISPEHINENIGLAAQYMERFLDHEKQLIGLGWGSTISWMTRNITHSTRSETSFITLCGGVTTTVHGLQKGLSAHFSRDFVILSTSYTTCCQLRNQGLALGRA